MTAACRYIPPPRQPLGLGFEPARCGAPVTHEVVIDNLTPGRSGPDRLAIMSACTRHARAMICLHRGQVYYPNIRMVRL